MSMNTSISIAYVMSLLPNVPDQNTRNFTRIHETILNIFIKEYDFFSVIHNTE